jgi:hypothetical protein
MALARMVARGLLLRGRPRRARRKKVERSQEVNGEAGKGDDEPASWVPALTVFNQVQAHMTVARLGDQGIPARLRREAASRALPVNVGLLGLIDVMVPELMLEQALEIVEDLAEAEIVPDEETPD